MAKNQRIKVQFFQKKEKNIDIISSLPDHVLHHILSFLPTAMAIRTSALSRRWKYVWTSISTIELDDRFRHYESQAQRIAFLDCIDRVLSLHDDSDVKKLRFAIQNPISRRRLRSWLGFARRHNVQDLDLTLSGTSFPWSLITCPSLATLSIYADFVLKAPLLTPFSNLVDMELNSITFADDLSVQQLFSNCPILEYLNLTNCQWDHERNAVISIPTLKWMIILQEAPHEPSSRIEISAPNLTSFGCFSTLNVKLFMSDLCSLNSATIDFCYGDEISLDEIAGHGASLLSAIKNIKSLRFTQSTLSFILDVVDLPDRLPMFYNLTTLEFFTTVFPGSGGVLMEFLKKAPKLEVLQFSEGFLSDDDDLEVDLTAESVPPCFKSHFKMFEITNFERSPEAMKVVGFVLENATVLEKLEIYCSRSLSTDVERLKEEVSNELNMLPKGSKRCVIELL